jgi:type II secretory pathway component PulJ
MTGLPHGTRTRLAGFTLVEALAALAVASVIILATAALTHNVALHFDRGTRGVDQAERIMLAVERLAGDFGSSRFVSRMSDAGPAIAFMAEPASGDKPARILFVGARSVMSGPQGDEVVSLTVERDGELKRLVRRRAAWGGPATRFEDVGLQDEVVLIEGRIDIAFAFGRVMPDGALGWTDGWIGEPTLPRFVRLILRDRATGADLLGEADFIVRANAPPACGRSDATTGCLAAVPGRPSP